MGEFINNSNMLVELVEETISVRMDFKKAMILGMLGLAIWAPLASEDFMLITGLMLPYIIFLTFTRTLLLCEIWLMKWGQGEGMMWLVFNCTISYPISVT